MGRGVVASAAVFSLCLLAGTAYCQELTEREKQIFYDGAELEMSITSEMLEGNQQIEFAQVIGRYGITEEQLDDIIERGRKMPLSAEEERVAQDIREKLSPLPAGPLTEAELRILRDLSLKHGMRLGQVGSVLVRILPEEEEEE